MSAADIVDTYLELCERRALGEAAAFISPSARLQFPGGAEYRGLPEMVSAPKAYRWVRKHRDRYAVADDGDRTIVTSIGRLYGERLDGTRFEDVRYVDVFVLCGGLIEEQLVWNDLCEAGITAPPLPDRQPHPTTTT